MSKTLSKLYIDPWLGDGDGWYCHIFNISDSDIALYGEGGDETFISSASGPTKGSMNIKSWSTVRVSLVYEPQILVGGI